MEMQRKPAAVLPKRTLCHYHPYVLILLVLHAILHNLTTAVLPTDIDMHAAKFISYQDHVADDFVTEYVAQLYAKIVCIIL